MIVFQVRWIHVEKFAETVFNQLEFWVKEDLEKLSW